MYSTHLKLLVTSQQKIQAAQKSSVLEVRPLSPDPCYELVESLKREKDTLNPIQVSHNMCKAVGNTPMVVKLLVKSFLPTRRKTFEGKLLDMSYILETLKKIESPKQRITSALILTLNNVEYDCQVTALLLSRFSLTMSEISSVTYY